MSSEIKQRFVYVLTRTNKADDDETDVYVGSTSLSLRQRLWMHRYGVKRSNSKLYERMRTVGIYNWEIIPLLQRTCDKKTIRELESKWYKIMNADLNTISPVFDFDNKKKYNANYHKENKERISQQKVNYRKKNKQDKIHHCEVCDISFGYNKDLQRHLKSRGHFRKYIYSVD